MVKKIKIKKLPEEIKEAIQISELKYRRLFETAQDGVLLLDAQTGQINDVNPFLMRLLGYSKKEFLNKKLWDIGAFVDIQAAKKAFRILKKKRYVRYKNLPLQTKQGKLINVEFVSNVYGLDHEKVIQCNIRDITERRKTEIIIKENEEKFRHIYENNRDGVMVVDIKSRKFIIGNNAFCKMIGYSAKELIKIGVDDIHPKKDLPFVLKKFSQMVQGITKTADNLPVKRKDGSIFYVDVVASPVNLYGKKYIMGSFRDITERKKVEEVIRESEKKFRTIFDNSRDGIILADAKSRNFLMANNSVCRMLKYSKKEILKIGVENIHPQNKLNYVIKQFNRQLRGEIKLASQLPVKKKNGEIFYADVIATPLELSGKKCILGSFRDVTKSKKAEEIIKENEEKYRTIFNASPDLIVIIDKKGNILDANNLVDSWMKYKRKDIIGKKVLNLDFFTPESKKMVGKKIKERFTNKKMGVYELNFINKKGEIRTAEVRGNLIGKESNKNALDLVFLTDVTREKEIDKMKTEFVSLASHQLRTPITSINWNTEMLLNGDMGNISEEQRIVLNEIHRSNERMISLINALLNVSRLEMGTFAIEPKLIDIIQISRKNLQEMEAHIKEEKIELVEKYDPKIKSIMADPKLVDIILQNLISNAVRYCKEQGKIEIEIRKNKEDISIKVADNGVGIPKYQQEKVFSKLFRADNAQAKDPNGTGLGLYITSLILKAINGKIWFKSKEGEGTTFYASLPLGGMKEKVGVKSLVQTN